LALDLKLDDGLLPFLDQLDEIVLDYDGRLYLSKDSRMSQDMFRATYPRWEEWLDVRRRYGADQLLHSRQSERLGL
ncbi:MAG: FAD-binding protein, partial [Acidimicrobiales bacterium]